MTASKNYWIAIPGSTDPPLGPLPLEDVRVRVAAGSIPRDATICEVGRAEWVAISSVMPTEPVKLAPSPVVSKRPIIEAQYVNLAKVAEGIKTYGDIIKTLGIIVGISGLGAAIFLEGLWKTVGILPVVLGILVHVMGTIVAASGEAILALRDIAVNTRISADRSEGRDV